MGLGSKFIFVRLSNTAGYQPNNSNIYDSDTRLAKRREILIFPRTAGNTGNSRELLVIPGNYWEISYLLTKKLLIYLLTAIQLYLQCKNNHYNSTFYQIIK